jgi:RNA polymerase sigma-70 factor, ECF subfamily
MSRPYSAKHGTGSRGYVRLAEQGLPQGQNRAHFFGVAAQLMRQILVDYARSHRASKRGGYVYKLALADEEERPQALAVDIVALDDALKALADMDSRQS